jgi:hypothetical protein
MKIFFYSGIIISMMTACSPNVHVRGNDFSVVVGADFSFSAQTAEMEAQIMSRCRNIAWREGNIIFVQTNRPVSRNADRIIRLISTDDQNATPENNERYNINVVACDNIRGFVIAKINTNWRVRLVLVDVESGRTIYLPFGEVYLKNSSQQMILLSNQELSGEDAAIHYFLFNQSSGWNSIWILYTGATRQSIIGWDDDQIHVLIENETGEIYVPRIRRINISIFPLGFIAKYY